MQQISRTFVPRTSISIGRTSHLVPRTSINIGRTSYLVPRTSIKHLLTLCLLLTVCSRLMADDLTQYVDPRIGSEGLGRVFVGPATPFGMVRPGPDCTCRPNSGWLPMPEVVTGFAQTHVSGTGGGPKYGNILIQPYLGELGGRNHEQRRIAEEMSCGYYSATFESGLRTEITTSDRCSFYRIGAPLSSPQEGEAPDGQAHRQGSAESSPFWGDGRGACLMIDCGFFLGENPIPNAREAQQFVGSEVEIVSQNEVRGFTRIRGGWNNGRAYTVYFCLVSDTPFADTLTWSDPDGKTGAWVRFGTSPARSDLQSDCSSVGDLQSPSFSPINLRVGISFISSLQAKRNIPDRSFDEQLATTRSQWNELLGRIRIEGTIQQKRMFYTALYHTMLMPSDRTGENPSWNDGNLAPRTSYLAPRNNDSHLAPPYYDDFYALWDTYRTSMPLITLIDPDRQRDIVNALINIGQHDGYMPDARSGNSNGRTQGGSHAEVVIADAFAKGLTGIDYEEALRLMLKDADVPPGGNEEQEGRGGLMAYNSLGYVPYGIDRAGTRTVEYAFDDWCIAQVAKGLGHEQLYQRFMQQSENWKNLWRDDYEWEGIRGFIMPRSATGEWLDSVPMRGNEYRGYGGTEVRGCEKTSVTSDIGNLAPSYPRTSVPSKYAPLFRYTPIIREGPWYVPWWGTFFYEATSQEYSLSIPHDVAGLIEKCGGREAFRQRLDTFFERGYYNVANEPSFLTPCLYHWIDRPDLTSERVHDIVHKHFNDSPTGIPGNDDSGAMSSWLAFHMMGLYPLAGEARYLLHEPMLPAYTLGRLHVVAKKLKAKKDFTEGILLNGRPLGRAWITHEELMNGGELVLPITSVSSLNHKGTLGENQRSAPTGKANSFVEGEGGNLVPRTSHHAPRNNDSNLSPLIPDRWSPTRSLSSLLSPRNNISYTLHRQYRTWPLSFSWQGDTLRVGCKDTYYYIARTHVEQADHFCWQQPLDGQSYVVDGTFAFISNRALAELKKNGAFTYDDILWQRIDDSADDSIIHVKAPATGTEMWIDAESPLPLVLELRNNPFGIEWRIKE